MILHVDMDAFFAAVEQASDPRLRGRPVVVCGDPDRRGTVATASYEAREFGVEAGMPTSEARRRCPEGVFLEGQPEKYRSVSLYLLEIYKRITPAVEPFSIDEAFLDLAGTPFDRNPDTVRAAAETIQRWVRERLGLSATIGIGPNKLVAKMASGIQKPRGLTMLDADTFRRRFWSLPTDDLWGIGAQTSAALARLGVRTVGDLAHYPAERLAAAFGVNGPRMKIAAWGEDTSPVLPYYEGVDAKSMGHEFTLLADQTDSEVLEGLLVRLSDQVARRMRKEGYQGRIVVLKLRYSDFETLLRQRALATHTDDERILASIARKLLRENRDRRAVRLLGVTMAGLEKSGGTEQPSIFASERRARALTREVDRVRDHWGERSLLRAAALR
ncbi:MAG: DNA polymerase IV [Candidatus Eiseniibacteriota bacterium]